MDSCLSSCFGEANRALHTPCKQTQHTQQTHNHTTTQPLTMESCLSSCFGEANRALRCNSAIDCDLSGSTGIVSVVTAGGKLVVANLGDSRCVAGARMTGV